MGARVVTKEDKRLFEAVKKQDMQIRHLSNQNLMFRARVISILNNNWYLLLEECEISDSLVGIPYSSCRNLVNQIERNSFISSLSRELILKQNTKRK